MRAAVIFQLLVDFVPTIFLQKMIRNDVSSDMKVLQRFGDIEKALFTSPLVLIMMSLLRVVGRGEEQLGVRPGWG